MQNPRIPLAAFLFLVLALAPLASAHEHVRVGPDGSHELTIGWITEPPVVDQPNGVWVRILGPAPVFGSEMFGPDGSYSWTFNTVGVVGYHCHPHPWMQGNVTVVDGGHHGPATHEVKIHDSGDSSTYRFEPENLTVNKGDTVVWKLDANSTMMHTVTPTKDHGHEESGGHEMTEGAHGAASPATPVLGVEKTLKATVTIAGKSREFELKGLHGQPGVYVGRFIPTVPGTYTVRFHGTVDGHEVNVTTDLQRVEALDANQFPEKTSSLFELQKEIAALKAQAEAKANTPAEVIDQNPTPFVGVGLLAVALVGVALLLRRRS